jgi:imidazolonepropionase-like amidohydrolase
MFVRVWGMKAAFGENPKRVYREQKKMPTTRMGTAAILRENLVKAQNYLKKLEAGEKDADKLPERDLRLEALVRVLRREHPLRAHAHRADDIVTAIRIAEEFDIKVSIEHCTEGHKIADYLAAKGVPCVVGPSMTGRGKVELRELTFETAGILARAGVKIALMTDHPVIPLQYLPICAGLAIRSGLGEEDALRAITINAAEIMGVSDRMGSIEPGKDADVIVLTGSPFELMTNVQYTLIDGRVVYEAK